MAEISLKGNPVHTTGNLPSVGDIASDFTLVKSDLSEVSLSDFEGKKVILNIFPSVDTGTCAMSVRTFNEKASGLKNTVVLCISRDLPFALQRFCGAEGIEGVITLSTFRDDHFAETYGTKLIDGPLKGLNARAVIVLNENREVLYTELVDEITEEPDYEAALSFIK